jgi:hypothetical protein
MADNNEFTVENLQRIINLMNRGKTDLVGVSEMNVKFAPNVSGRIVAKNDGTFVFIPNNHQNIDQFGR